MQQMNPANSDCLLHSDCMEQSPPQTKCYHPLHPVLSPLLEEVTSCSSSGMMPMHQLWYSMIAPAQPLAWLHMLQDDHTASSSDTTEHGMLCNCARWMHLRRLNMPRLAPAAASIPKAPRPHCHTAPPARCTEPEQQPSQDTSSPRRAFSIVPCQQGSRLAALYALTQGGMSPAETPQLCWPAVHSRRAPWG
jgi:hypothetical protein